LRPGIKPGEYVADPCVDLQWQAGASSPVNTVCLVDYRGKGEHTISEIDRDILFDYMEQFSLALNVYGLKEDVLDHLHGDVAAFSVQMRRARSQLRALVDRCRAYHVSCDATDPRGLENLYELLSSRPLAGARQDQSLP